MRNYPVDLDDCFNVGIWGGCGLSCYIYKEGRCEYHREMKDKLTTQEEKEMYEELYSF